MKSFIYKNRFLFIAAAAAVAVLAAVFIFSGTGSKAEPSLAPSTTASESSPSAGYTSAIPSSNSETVPETSGASSPAAAAPSSAAHTRATAVDSNVEITAEPREEAPTAKIKDDALLSGDRSPKETREQTTADTAMYCTFSVSCKNLSDQPDKLIYPDKRELLPSDGWIIKPVKVPFTDGESVFDLIKRVCRDNSIHLEFSWNPLYNTEYIEGINNLYEFDGGDNSGWIYKVNGWVPNYGCSRYILKNGDTVKFLYTLNNGADTDGL